MQTVRVRVRPRSAFGTPLAGDTLFGQMCWALRLRRGEHGLAALLEGYGSGRPFAVLSDAFPAGFVPRPAVPDFVVGRTVAPVNRKDEKRRQWLPVSGSGTPLASWLDQAIALPKNGRPMAGVVTQNTINRLTGTAGKGLFAPRQADQIVFPKGGELELYAVLDDARFGIDDLRLSLEDCGATGYGRDASTGLGKFEVAEVVPHRWPKAESAELAVTLAPCAPVPDSLDRDRCFYQPLTRFGRHGSMAAWSGEAGPFKRPILLLKTAAVLAFRQTGVGAFHGTGLGGEVQPISGVIPQTVHQGYAPLLPLAGGFSREAA